MHHVTLSVSLRMRRQAPPRAELAINPHLSTNSTRTITHMATLPLHVPALVGMWSFGRSHLTGAQLGIDSLSGSNYTFYGIRMYGRVVIVQADALPAYAKYHLPDDGGALPHEMALQDTLDAQRQRVHDIDIIVGVVAV